MRVRSVAGLAVFLVGCNTQLKVDPEGLQCDPGGLCPEGYSCIAGVCRSAGACPDGGCPDLCTGIRCATPPADECADALTLRDYADVGTCQSDGTCRYDATLVPCAGGCIGGACVDPCAQIACTTPPAPACLDGTTLRTYASPGTCTPASGTCAYAATDTSCANGCSGAKCQNQDLCAGKTCTTPPGPACVGGKVRTFINPGSCDSLTGQCSYAFTDAACAGTCISGICVPPGLTFQQTGPLVRSQINAVDQAPGSGGNHILAVGPAGTVAKWNGSAWSVLPSGTSSNLNAVWFVNENNPSVRAYIVGESGTVLTYNGTSLAAVSVPGAAGLDLVSVHGNRANHVLLASSGGEWFAFNGSQWTSGALDLTAGPYTMYSAYVDPVTGNERIAGLCGPSFTAKPCVAWRGASTFDIDKDFSGPPRAVPRRRSRGGEWRRFRLRRARRHRASP